MLANGTAQAMETPHPNYKNSEASTYLGKVTTGITQAPSNNHSRGLINVHFVYVCMDVSDTVQLKDNALSMPSLCLALF